MQTVDLVGLWYLRGCVPDGPILLQQAPSEQVVSGRLLGSSEAPSGRWNTTNLWNDELKLGVARAGRPYPNSRPDEQALHEFTLHNIMCSYILILVGFTETSREKISELI